MITYYLNLLQYHCLPLLWYSTASRYHLTTVYLSMDPWWYFYVSFVQSTPMHCVSLCSCINTPPVVSTHLRPLVTNLHCQSGGVACRLRSFRSGWFALGCVLRRTSPPLWFSSPPANFCPVIRSCSTAWVPGSKPTMPFPSLFTRQSRPRNTVPRTLPVVLNF